MSLFTDGLAEAVMNGDLEDDSDDAVKQLLIETGEAVFSHARAFA